MLQIKNYILMAALSLPFFIGCAFAKENTYQGPGFDCAKARTMTEKTICSDKDLSKQDWQLFETYYVAQKKLVGKPYANISHAQHIFLNKRNGCKDNKSCIAKITSTRIDQLKTLGGKQILADCSDRDKQYSRSFGVSAEEAFNFGLKIQKIVKKKELQALLALVDGELKIRGRKASIKDKRFDDLFPPGWRETILLDEPHCIPPFSLGDGRILYDNDPQSSADGKWKIVAINNALVSFVNESNRVWIYKGKKLTLNCFTSPWYSGDNYEQYYEAYIGDKADIHNYYQSAPYVKTSNIPFADFLKYIGRYIGKQVPIVPELDNEGAKFPILAVKINACPSASPFLDYDQASYTVIRSIPQRFCKTLAPNYPESCRQLRLIEVENCGGSMGCDIRTGIYGIVEDPKTNGTYVVPLANLGTLDDALTFVDELEK